MDSAIWQLDKFVFGIIPSASGVLTLWFLNRNEAVSFGLERGITKSSYDRVITANDCHHPFAFMR